MEETPERKVVQEALEKAVVAHTEAHRPPSRQDIPEMVGDWALVVNVISFNEEGHRTSAYNVAYVGGEMDEHRAAGLFRVGEKIALGEWMMAEEEE